MDYKKLAKDSAWVFAISFAIIPLNLLIRMLYARNLTIEDYGIFYGLIAFFGLFTFLSDFGVRSATPYIVSKYDVKKNHGKIKAIYFGGQIFQLTASLIVVTLMIIFRSDIITQVFNNSQNAPIMLNFFLLFWIINTIFRANLSFFIGYAETRTSKIFEFVNLLAVLIISYVLFFFFESYKVPVIAYLLAIIICALLTTVLFWYRHYNVFNAKMSYNRTLFKEIKKYSLAVVLASASQLIMPQIDTVILQTISGAESVAYYTTGVSAASLILVLAASVRIVLLPAFSRLWHKKEKARLSKLIEVIMHNLIIIALPISMLFSLFSLHIIILLFGEGLAPSQIVLQFFAFVFIIKLYNEFLFMCLKSTGKPGKFSKAMIIGLVINVVLDLILIPQIGIKGAIIATSATYLFIFIYAINYIKKTVKIRIHKMKLLKIGAASAGFVLTSLILYTQYAPITMYSTMINSIANHSIAFLAGLAAYSILLIVLKAIDITTILWMKQLVMTREKK